MIIRSEKRKSVAFVDMSLKKALEKLKSGKSEEEKINKFIFRAIEDLKENPFCGTVIPKRLWPRLYIQKYNIKNLGKYNLPDAWRLIYTIKEDEIEIMSILIEWFNHKIYERRFRY